MEHRGWPFVGKGWNRHFLVLENNLPGFIERPGCNARFFNCRLRRLFLQTLPWKNGAFRQQPPSAVRILEFPEGLPGVFAD